MYMVLLPALPVAASPLNLLVNGGFETPLLPTATFQEYCPGGEPAGFGWTVLSSSCSDVFSQGVLGTTADVYEGNQALDLVGLGSNGEIAQTILTTPGTSYQLTFVYGNNALFTASASALVTVMDGSNTLLSDSVTHSTSSSSDVHWTMYSGWFVASGTSATLDFTETVGNANGGVLLDAVSLADPPVPEPSASLLVGIGLLAFAASLRRVRRHPRS